MGILGKVIERRASPENPSTNLANPADWLIDWASGQPSKAGVRVGEQKSLGISSVWACVNLYASTLGSLPLILYRRSPDCKSRERATNHPAYRLAHDTPNEFYTSFTWRETSMGHVLTWGNAYSEIIGRRAPRELRLLRPDHTRPEVTTSGRLFYTHDPGGDASRRRLIRPEDMIHVAGLGFDGVRGYSVIQTHRESMGLSVAALEYGSSWFGNGSRPSGVLNHPATLSDDAGKKLRLQWEALHAGSDNWNKTAILEEGMSWQSIGMPPADSQFIETKVFQVQDAARIYNIPPHMIQELSKATFSNIEHQAIQFVTHSVRPWLVRWEQELNRKLLSTRDRETHFFEFLVDGLLRGDVETRFKSYALGRQWGWLSTNDVRRLENMNPVPDGDDYLVPLNMVPSDDAGDQQGDDDE